MRTVEVTVPDIGDFSNVDVIEVMVRPGDRVKKDQPLVTLESDKASMEIPSSHAGIVREVRVKPGDRASEGTVLVLLEEEEAPSSALPEPPEENAPQASPPADGEELACDTLVLGAGPGGYTAAFRAADLGQKVILVERYATLGGVCLNVGCIPSKALLHAAKVITDAQEMEAFGIHMGQPLVDTDRLRAWKASVVKRLADGLGALAKARQIRVIRGTGKFSSPFTMTVETAEGSRQIRFASAIIAAGSSAAKIPGFPYGHPALADSTAALEPEKIPERMLVIGGGVIGLEMACIYDALGSKITIVEASGGLIPSADPDVVRVLQARIEKRYEAVMLNTKVTHLEAQGPQLLATFEGEDAPGGPEAYDMVLLAVGRRPNGPLVGAGAAGVTVDGHGYIRADSRQRTNVPHIFAIGDICGEPMLAHKASAQGRVAAEVIAGEKAAFDVRTIPAVAYTDPEIAWMGLTESEAKAKGIPYEKSVFPWAASGRALTMARTDGMTKLLWDPESRKILGGAIAGTNAGELLAELVLALEMDADLEDIALTLHAHPSLSETVMLAAETGLGSITDLYLPKRKAV